MKFIRILLLNVSLAATLFGLSLPAHAQVYQSTDSDGSVILSDQPTPGSKEIDVPEPNVGDSVDVPPPEPTPVVEPKPEIAIEELPPELQGELEGTQKKSNKRRRPRKEPRGGG